MLTGLNTQSSSVSEKSSYCFNTMSRIATMKKAIVQTEQLVNKTKESVEFELSKMLKNGDVAVELQKLNVRIRMLRGQLDRERNELRALRGKNLLLNKQTSQALDEKQQITNHNSSAGNMNHNMSISNSVCQGMSHNQSHHVSNSLSNHLSNNLPSLPNNLSPSHLPLSSSPNLSSVNFSHFTSLPENLFNNLPSSHSSVNDQTEITSDRENIKKVKMLLTKIENEISYKNNLLEQINESLEFSERKLMTELSEIFPVNQSQGSFTLVGLQLPDLSVQLDENDVQIKISLGYCCQLLIAISKVFDVRLKHSILFAGSQSWIANETENPKLKDKKYPLFLNRDKAKFNVAIFLLNENIVQLRHHFNLHTPDHKKLSANLFTLFHNKLLLKEEEMTTNS